MEQAKDRLIATQLPPTHPVVLGWARTVGQRPRSRWAIRISTSPNTSGVPGWENVTFDSYSVTRRAIEFIEETGGSYEEFADMIRQGYW